MDMSKLKDVLSERTPTTHWKSFLKERGISKIVDSYKLKEDEPIQMTVYNILNDVLITPKCKCGNDLGFYHNRYRMFCSKACANAFMKGKPQQKKKHPGKNIKRKEVEPRLLTKEELKTILREREPTRWWKSFLKERGISKIVDSYKLKEDEPIQMTVYNILNDVLITPKCKCGNDLGMYNNEYRIYCSKKCTSKFTTSKRVETYFKRTGYKSPLLNPVVKESMKVRSLQLYGEESPARCDAVKNKRKKTKLERYGDENYTNSRLAKLTKLERYGDEKYNNTEQRKNTCLERYGTEYYTNRELSRKTKRERYGDEHYNNRELAKKTNLERYGVECTFMLEEQKEKTKITNLARYGVSNFSQTENGSNGYKWKEYVMPSGEVRKIQGYENFLLDWLLKSYDECDIKTARVDMPEFWYLTSDSKSHRYFPDAFVVSTGTVYEVKSSYTVKLNETVNGLKFKSVQDAGFSFVLKVYDSKGNEL